MGTRTRAYLAELWPQMLEMVRSGRMPEELAKEFKASSGSIQRWAWQAPIEAGKRKELPSEEREELTQLRRANRDLKLEREILRRIAPWFARESETAPERGSSSSEPHEPNTRQGVSAERRWSLAGGLAPG